MAKFLFAKDSRSKAVSAHAFKCKAVEEDGYAVDRIVEDLK